MITLQAARSTSRGVLTFPVLERPPAPPIHQDRKTFVPASAFLQDTTARSRVFEATIAAALAPSLLVGLSVFAVQVSMVWLVLQPV